MTDQLEPTTLDSLYEGRLLLEQPRRGYRFTVDSVALTARVAAHAPSRVLDVGAGIGVVALSVATLGSAHVDAIEVEATSARLLRANVARNGVGERVTCIEADVRVWSRAEGATRRYDVIALNPPYFAPERSRAAPDGQRAAARHELHGTVEQIVKSVAPLLRSRGALEVVYPTRSLSRLLGALDAAQLRRLSLRFVHALASRDAYAVLATARPGRESLATIEPPLVLANDDGTPTAEALALASASFASHARGD